jgi:hypothetical protein
MILAYVLMGIQDAAGWDEYRNANIIIAGCKHKAKN